MRERCLPTPRLRPLLRLSTGGRPQDTAPPLARVTARGSPVGALSLALLFFFFKSLFGSQIFKDKDIKATACRGKIRVPS